MKLYYIPGACSLAPHICACEAGIKLELVKVEGSVGVRTAGGRDFRTINPKAMVSTLQDGEDILTENQVILQYLADKEPKLLGGATSGMKRWRLLEVLNFVSTELHQAFGPLYTMPAVTHAPAVELIGKKFDVFQAMLKDQPYVAGDQFTIADAYAFTVLNWATFNKIDLARWPKLAAYHQRMALRPSVQRALREEGLLK